MTKCPKCNADNPSAAKFCENCGNILSGNKNEATQSTDLKFCPDCGSSIEPDASFCANCGSSFGEQCHHCNTINQSEAKFCSSCAQPLNWICPICKNKNRAGALFCADCGSDGMMHKPIYKNIKYISAAAVVLILIGIAGFSIFNSNDSVKQENNGTKTNQSNRSSSTGSPTTNSSNCKGYASIKFKADPVCIIKSSLSVSNVDNYSSISTDNFYHSASIGGVNCIAGSYRFSWTFYSQCVNVGKPDGPYSYSGTFYLDGKHSEYRISISDSWGNVSIDVVGL